MKPLLKCDCGATARDTCKERKRFKLRHPRLCTERRKFTKQLAQSTRSVEYDEQVFGREQ
jgi:hypothetical protein